MTYKNKTIKIIETNEAIALFMRYRLYDYGLRRCVVEGKNKLGTPVDELKYHSSWGWLMPVWFKIQTIGADMGYVFKKFYEAFHAGIDYQSIGKCHYTIYEFIQWYNNQPPHQ